MEITGTAWVAVKKQKGTFLQFLIGISKGIYVVEYRRTSSEMSVVNSSLKGFQ